MDKKVLIYMQSSELAPVGGPRGYIYNLKKELDKRNYTNIYFIENQRKVINKYKNKIEGMKKGTLKNIFIIIKSIIKHWGIIYGKNHRALVDLNEYDFVHFHSSLDMYNVRDSLKDYRGKVILSSHSPTLLSKEIYESRSNFEKLYCGFIYNKLISMDEYAFENADYFVFPCSESEEPYYNNWDKYSIIKEKNEQKYRYVLTGIPECSVKIGKDEIRKKYDIPNDAFVISYVGRHNRIKGYDILQDICSEVLKNDNVYVLVAGKEEPLKGLGHSHWIEVGWTNDPHSIIAASDVFVLPNRETYFDLVMLEVLSLGQIVVGSKTGGNNYFEKLDSDGILLFHDKKEAVDTLEYLIDLPEEKRMKKRQANKRLYEENFTCEIFADKYIKLYESLVAEQK